jgi:hypothetical protein
VPLSDTETVGYEAQDLSSPTLATSSLWPGDHSTSEPSQRLHASRSPEVTLAPAHNTSSGFHHGSIAPAVSTPDTHERSDPNDGNAANLEETPITGDPTPGTTDFASVAENSVPVAVVAASTIAGTAPEVSAPGSGEETAPSAPGQVEAADTYFEVDHNLPTKHNLAPKPPSVQLTPGGSDPRPIFSASPLDATSHAQATRELSPLQTSSLQVAGDGPPQGTTAVSASQRPVEVGTAGAQSAALPASLPFHENRDARLAPSEVGKVVLSPQPSSLESALASSPFARDSQLPSQDVAADGWEQMGFSDTLRLDPDRTEFSPPPLSQDSTGGSDAVRLQQGN